MCFWPVYVIWPINRMSLYNSLNSTMQGGMESVMLKPSLRTTQVNSIMLFSSKRVKFFLLKLNNIRKLVGYKSRSVDGDVKQ